MPDVRPPEQHAGPDASAPAVAPASPARASIYRDPVVRRMALAAFVLVIVFLATVLGALVTGVFTQSGPRTLAEKQLAIAGSEVGKGNVDPAVWGEYISALVASKQFSRAERVLADGRASLDDSLTAEFNLAEARILSGRGEKDAAIEMATKAQKQIKTSFDKAIKGGGPAARTIKANGISANFYEAALVKAYAYVDQSKWKEAIKEFGVYIDKEPGAADILVDRGNAKIAAGDKAGAEKDFRTSLKFIPDNEEALAGLEKIGAAK